MLQFCFDKVVHSFDSQNPSASELVDVEDQVLQAIFVERRSLAPLFLHFLKQLLASAILLLELVSHLVICVKF